MKIKKLDCVRVWRFLSFIAVLGFILTVPAQAQFVCGGSATGAETQTGAGATAAGSTFNVACGSDAKAGGNGGENTATGALADASGDNSVNTANGFAADANGANSSNTATVEAANASGDTSANTASGLVANASGNNSSNVAMGDHANASGSFSNNAAAGHFANASGNGSSNIAVGDHADAHGDNSKNIAIGANSHAANDSIAFGTGAQAAFVNSAAFGNGAVATRANQQVFGTLSNTYSMPGLPLPASNAAQFGATRVVTTDGFGNLGSVPFTSLGLASSSDLAALSLTVDHLRRLVRRANTGVSMAFALAGVPTLLPGKKFALSANWGTFDNENGAALSGALRVYHDMQFNASFAYGFRENVPGGRAGVSYQW